MWKRSLFRQKLNHLDQYGRRNNLVLSCIPDTEEDNGLENPVSSTLSDLDVTIRPHDVETCHRVGLSVKSKSKKTIIRLVNCRYAKKALIIEPILDIRGICAFLGGNFFKKGSFCLLAPPKQMSFLTISNENIFFLKNQGTRLGVIIAPNKGLEQALNQQKEIRQH